MFFNWSLHRAEPLKHTYPQAARSSGVDYGPVITPNFLQESAYFGQGHTFIVGCDEVGRGCLAGPVVAATVVFAWSPEDFLFREPWLKGIRDSKTLSPQQRAAAETLIRAQAKGIGVGVVAPEMIDEINIHQASLLAMKKAVLALPEPLQSAPVLVDGRFVIPGLHGHQRAIIDGDALVFSIAAASIVAKEYRDRLMVELDKQFPVYGFAQHKGYATLQHRKAILAHGLLDAHRLSFCGAFGPQVASRKENPVDILPTE